MSIVPPAITRVLTFNDACAAHSDAFRGENDGFRIANVPRPVFNDICQGENAVRPFGTSSHHCDCAVEVCLSNPSVLLERTDGVNRAVF
jgi:hypothetical protein